MGSRSLGRFVPTFFHCTLPWESSRYRANRTIILRYECKCLATEPSHIATRLPSQKTKEETHYSMDCAVHTRFHSGHHFLVLSWEGNIRWAPMTEISYLLGRLSKPRHLCVIWLTTSPPNHWRRQWRSCGYTTTLETGGWRLSDMRVGLPRRRLGFDSPVLGEPVACLRRTVRDRLSNGTSTDPGTSQFLFIIF